MVVREPIGIVGAIVPWNFPLLIAVWKIAASLAAGDVVILKPSELASLSCLRIAELATEAGLSDGVLNVVIGLGSEAGAALVEHPDVDMVTFTGSTATGQKIIKSTATQIKPLALELGGKGVQIIFSDADVTEAAKQVVFGFIYNSGQLCFAGSRVLVSKDIRKKFIAQLQKELDQYSFGELTNFGTRLGPLISVEHKNRVTKFVDDAIRDGATPVAYGPDLSIQSGHGNYFRAIVLESDQNSVINQEEVFGPVLSLVTFSGDDEALEFANDTQYGLSASIWTQSKVRAEYFTKRLKVGTIWINTFGRIHPAVPFGGNRQSGYGRDLGEESLNTYSTVKSVWQYRFNNYV